MSAKRIIGIVVVILVAVPVLFGGTLLMGVSRSVTHGWFSKEQAQKLARHLPTSLEHILKAASDPNQIQDPRAREWAQALTRTDPGLLEVVKETKAFDWAEKELVHLFGAISDALHGRTHPKAFVVDLRPLKSALKSQVMTQFLTKVLQGMPPCDQAEMNQWRRVLTRPKRAGIPGCTPGPSVADVQIAVKALQAKFDAIPDKKVIPVEGSGKNDRVSIDTIVALNWTAWLVLLGGLLLVVVGSLLAGETLRGKLAWGGIATAVAALPTLLIGLAVHGAFAMATRPEAWHLEESDPFWRTEVGRIAAQEAVWYVRTLIGDMFTKFTTVGLVVVGLGVAVAVSALFVPKGSAGGRNN